MVFNPAIPEISTVTSEALQAKLRQLLPSQDGFGTDLAAQNVIVPIIDLTQAAQGSDVSETLQSAIAFGSQTAFTCFNTTTVIENTVGFYRIIGTAVGQQSGSTGISGILQLDDGSSTKDVWAMVTSKTNSDQPLITTDFDLVFYLDTGVTLQSVCTANTTITGSSRQVADSNGNLVQPSGFNPQ